MNEIDPHFQSKSVRDSISRLTPLAKKQEDEEREKMVYYYYNYLKFSCSSN